MVIKQRPLAAVEPEIAHIGNTQHEINAMLQAMISSCNGMKLSALQLTRYLGNHFNYWAGGEFGHSRYPRSVLRIILNETFKDVGIRFPKPPQTESESEPAVPSPLATLREAVS